MQIRSCYIANTFYDKMQQTFVNGKVAVPPCHPASHRGLPRPHSGLRSERQLQVSKSLRQRGRAEAAQHGQRKSTIPQAISAPTVDRPAAASGTQPTCVYIVEVLTPATMCKCAWPKRSTIYNICTPFRDATLRTLLRHKNWIMHLQCSCTQT